MKKFLLYIFLLLPVILSAQDEDVSLRPNINLEFCASANAYLTEHQLDEAAFRINRARLVIKGDVSDKLGYYFRQSFTKTSNVNSLDNIASTIEYANMSWNQSDRFSLVAGKQFVSLGGYEAYLNSLMVRKFSEFNENYGCYKVGVSGSFMFLPDQQLIVQIVNNRSGRDADFFAYGRPESLRPTKLPLLATVNWNGYFSDKVIQLRYAASVGQLAQDKYIYYLTAGNVYKKGPVWTYLDVMYSREDIDCQGRVSSLQMGQANPVTVQNVEYLTLIANFDYRFHPKWNAFIKGTYETSRVFKDNGHFSKGLYNTSWNTQICLEWFPFDKHEDFKTYIHYLHEGQILTEYAKSLGAAIPDRQRIELGIVYTIPVI